MGTIRDMQMKQAAEARAKMSFFDRVLIPVFFFTMVVLTTMVAYAGYKIDGVFLSIASGVSWFVFFFMGLMWSVGRTGE